MLRIWLMLMSSPSGRGGAAWRDPGLVSVTTSDLTTPGHFVLCTLVLEVPLSSIALWSFLRTTQAVHECQPALLLQRREE